ncbi:hypothetical protein EDB86DRAFT_421310 [Lactarius hatsudake]|nr:hypothetical protein EDB86DRAFT_421310 [Lactarius hatsudake]
MVLSPFSLSVELAVGEKGKDGSRGRLVIHEHQNNARRHTAGFRLRRKRDCALVEQPLRHRERRPLWDSQLLYCCTAVLVLSYYPLTAHCCPYWPGAHDSDALTVGDLVTLPPAIRNTRRRQRELERHSRRWQKRGRGIQLGKDKNKNNYPFVSTAKIGCVLTCRQARIQVVTQNRMPHSPGRMTHITSFTVDSYQFIRS